MDILYKPVIDENWVEKVLNGEYGGQIAEEDSVAHMRKDNAGTTTGKYHQLSPGNLSVFYCRSAMGRAVTLKALPSSETKVFVIQFYLSQYAGCFHIPGAMKPVICCNGIRSCLFSGTAHEVIMWQQDGHPFECVQVCIAEPFMRNILQMAGMTAKAHLLNEDLARISDLFMEEQKLLDDIVDLMTQLRTSMPANLLLLTYSCQRLLGNVVKNMLDSTRVMPVTYQMELKKIAWVRDQVTKQPGRKYSLEEAASLINMSVSKFTKLFRKSTGQSFKEYCQQARMDYYMHKINGNVSNSITAIAYDAGYGSLSQFTKAFKKMYGTPPSSYYQRKK